MLPDRWNPRVWLRNWLNKPTQAELAQPDDPSRKNPKPSNPRSPWRAYNPGWLRERSPQWQEKRRG